MKQHIFGCVFCRNEKNKFHIIIRDDLTIIAKCCNCGHGHYIGEMHKQTLKRNQTEGLII